MKLNYYYADPVGNITLLVTSKAKPEDYPELAARLLALEPAAEQVGFVEAPEQGGNIRLHMAGGEFCGNASLSTAALWLHENGIERGQVRIEVYGQNKLLDAELAQVSTGKYAGNITMPLPHSMSVKSFYFKDIKYDLPLVELPGISHILFYGDPFPEAPDAIRHWCHTCGASALGILFLAPDASSLIPLVYVADGDSLYWEHSCASGTCAAAAWLARGKHEPSRYYFKEPGGLLSAEACDGTLRLIGSAALRERTIEL